MKRQRKYKVDIKLLNLEKGKIGGTIVNIGKSKLRIWGMLCLSG